MSIMGELKTMAMCHGYEWYKLHTTNTPPQTAPVGAGCTKVNPHNLNCSTASGPKACVRVSLGLAARGTFMYLHLSGGNVLLDPQLPKL